MYRYKLTLRMMAYHKVGVTAVSQEEVLAPFPLPKSNLFTWKQLYVSFCNYGV